MSNTTKFDIFIDEAKPIHKRHARIVQFTHSSTKAAVCMLLGAIVALIVANSPASEAFVAFWETEVAIGFGSSMASMPLSEIINDILMAVFFLLVGLEIKYEMTAGELTNIRQAILPVGAAIGGVIVPIIIYRLFNAGSPETIAGWGIPSATDIAFALGILSLLGSRVPSGIRVFLSTLAVADDIIAILIIAIFYGEAPSPMWLAAAAAVLAILIALNRSHIYSLTPYMLVGCLLWYCIFMSGVHSTIAGVLLAFTIPSGSNIKLGKFIKWSGDRVSEAEEHYDPDEPVIGQKKYLESVSQLAGVAQSVVPPATRLERSLYPWVYFLILPLFALTNADVSFMSMSAGEIFTSPVFHGVFFGLVLGKPIGIMLMSFIIVKTGLSELPEGCNWMHMLGASILGGVGFTMGIFVTNLAFVDEVYVATAKVAILMASAVAGLLGFAVLYAQAKVASSKGVSYDIEIDDEAYLQSYATEEVRRRREEATLTGTMPAIRYRTHGGTNASAAGAYATYIGPGVSGASGADALGIDGGGHAVRDPSAAARGGDVMPGAVGAGGPGAASDDEATPDATAVRVPDDAEGVDASKAGEGAHVANGGADGRRAAGGSSEAAREGSRRAGEADAASLAGDSVGADGIQEPLIPVPDAPDLAASIHSSEHADGGAAGVPTPSPDETRLYDIAAALDALSDEPEDADGDGKGGKPAGR